MTATGWIFMLLSLGAVWSLAIWCYSRILRPRPAEAALPSSEQRTR